MDFNTRMSQQFRSTAGPTGNGTARTTKRKEDDSDAFMRLVKPTLPSFPSIYALHASIF